jgi:hypothetical protein
MIIVVSFILDMTIILDCGTLFWNWLAVIIIHVTWFRLWGFLTIIPSLIS